MYHSATSRSMYSRSLLSNGFQYLTRETKKRFYRKTLGDLAILVICMEIDR